MTQTASFAPVVSARYVEAGGRAIPLYGLLCRALAGGMSTDEWPDLSPGEWVVLTKMAIQEGVASLLWRVSGREGWRTQLPTSAATTLRLMAVRIAAHNAVLLTELEQVLAALAAVRIKTLLLKGAALAFTLYEDPSLRPMGDIDLLVPIEQIRIADRIVESLGYRPELSRLRRWLMAPLLNEHNYDGGNKIRTHVELHWNIVFGATSRYRPDVTWFWEHARPVQVGQQTTSALGPDAELLHLAAHVALKHGEAQASLRWYYDLHLLIEKYKDNIIWNDVLAQAATWHWSSGLYTALLSTQERFNTRIPESILSQLSAACTAIDMRHAAGRSSSQHLRRAAANWRIQGWRGRLALLTMILIPRPSLLKRWLRDL